MLISVEARVKSDGNLLLCIPLRLQTTCQSESSLIKSLAMHTEWIFELSNIWRRIWRAADGGGDINTSELSAPRRLLGNVLRTGDVKDAAGSNSHHTQEHEGVKGEVWLLLIILEGFHKWHKQQYLEMWRKVIGVR